MSSLYQKGTGIVQAHIDLSSSDSFHIATLSACTTYNLKNYIVTFIDVKSIR